MYTINKIFPLKIESKSESKGKLRPILIPDLGR